MTPEQADKILTALKAAFPHADSNLDPLQAKARDAVYRRAFLAWKPKAAQSAVNACVLTCKFYPTVAELHDAYSAANRAQPERALASNALPKPGHTVASPEEAKAAYAAAAAAVEANCAVPNSPTGRTISDPPSADPETEREMIQRTIARARGEGDRS